MSLRVALILAVLIFAATVIARLPARAVTPLLPTTVTCEDPQGTLWHGACGRLHSGTLSVSGVGWTLHPSALLELRVSADLSSADARMQGQAHIELQRDGALLVQALRAQLPLRGGLALVPAGFDGEIAIDVATLRVRDDRLSELTGTVRALQLRSEIFGDLGTFELVFPAARTDAPPESPSGSDASADLTPIVSQLRDLSGPLSLQASVRISGGTRYDVSGTVMARPSASADLSQALQLLGTPDAQGRRRFSFAGSL